MSRDEQDAGRDNQREWAEHENCLHQQYIELLIRRLERELRDFWQTMDYKNMEAINEAQ